MFLEISTHCSRFLLFFNYILLYGSVLVSLIILMLPGVWCYMWYNQEPNWATRSSEAKHLSSFGLVHVCFVFLQHLQDIFVLFSEASDTSTCSYNIYFLCLFFSLPRHKIYSWLFSSFFFLHSHMFKLHSCLFFSHLHLHIGFWTPYIENSLFFLPAQSRILSENLYELIRTLTWFCGFRSLTKHPRFYTSFITIACIRSRI